MILFKAIPHNSKYRYGERGAADAKPKAQIILDAAKVSAASGGCSEPKQGQRSQSARGFCPRCTMRVPQPDIIEHFGNADAVPQPPERCLSRQAGIVRCCLSSVLEVLNQGAITEVAAISVGSKGTGQIVLLFIPILCLVGVRDALVVLADLDNFSFWNLMEALVILSSVTNLPQ